MSVPKLDFSNIFNNYNKKPFYIQEVKYVSEFLMDDSDEKKSDFDSEDVKIRKRKKKDKKVNQKII